MLDLSKFATPVEAIAPIVAGWGRIHTRKIHIPGTEDGWYQLTLGDRIQIIRRATPLEVLKTLQGKKTVRVYALGSEGIPLSFDNFFRKGLGEAIAVHFMSLPAFSVAKVVQWEDGRFYFLEQDSRFDRTMLRSAKLAFDNDRELLVKGVTPELRYYWLLLNLQRQSFRAYQEMERLKLSEEERVKRVAEFQSTWSGRLQTAIERAGGSLVKYEKYGSGYIVHWRVGDQLVKSTIRDDLRIINAGFCLQGADRQHTLSSAIALAQLFQEVSPLHLTRE